MTFNFDIVNNVTQVQDLLLEHYLNWQKRERSTKNITEFAHYLGVTRSLLSLLLNGRRNLSPKTANVLYIATGDARFFDAAGVDQPPDLRLLAINARWPELDEDAKKKIGDIANAYKQKK